jgi:hypothetical protein
MTQLVLQADVGDQLLLVGAEVHQSRPSETNSSA